VKRALLATAALAAAVGVCLAFTLPPARLKLPVQDDGTVSGVLHIHTNRSDGRGAPADVALDAARAGLRFVVFTDHGDATRPPDPPMYHEGVLCLDGVEISTTGGHYVAIGLPAAPYPLRGEPRDVVDDVARLGGFGIAAHPDSPKRALQWEAWSAPFDGIEVINPDTSWRVQATRGGLRSKLRLLEALGAYPFRPPEAITSLLSDTSELMKRWEMLTRNRRVVAVAGTDAHSQIGILPIPSYQSSFRMLSVHVRPAHPLSGDATADGVAIVDGLRSGHVYTTVDGFAARPSFEFSASNLSGTAQQGDELGADGAVTLHVRSNAPPTFTATVWRGDQILETGHHESSFTVHAPEGPAVYRVEIYASGRRDLPPWIVSNPIYVRPVTAAHSSARAPEHPPAVAALPLFDGQSPGAWRVEEEPSSVGVMRVVPGQGHPDRSELNLHYQLTSDESRGSNVGLLVFCPQYVTPYDRVTFTVRADRPMRISVQLRTSRPGGAYERWQRSVYVDATAQTRTVYFDDLTPIDIVADRRTPPLADMSHVLFVVDTTNTNPGASGDIWISDVVLQR
jgi:hypothetical protein